MPPHITFKNSLPHVGDSNTQLNLAYVPDDANHLTYTPHITTHHPEPPTNSFSHVGVFFLLKNTQLNLANVPPLQYLPFRRWMQITSHPYTSQHTSETPEASAPKLAPHCSRRSSQHPRFYQHSHTWPHAVIHEELHLPNRDSTTR